MRDHENNSYAVVQIGRQCWLKENMRCTTSHTTDVNMVENPAGGSSSTERRAYYYNNDPASAANGYGLLYNWQAANSICPDGWHLPDCDEWSQMFYAAVAAHQPDVIPSPVFSDFTMDVFLGTNTSISSMLSGGTDWNADNSGNDTRATITICYVMSRVLMLFQQARMMAHNSMIAVFMPIFGPVALEVAMQWLWGGIIVIQELSDRLSQRIMVFLSAASAIRVEDSGL